ncbi:MAG TPA: hypothetical protein VNT26_02255, partial [Candidatus Sulfotelmatobacter sp.]|nr:hypothetical protein [Candidatus Sulfotelmatobacter sp.]
MPLRAEVLYLPLNGLALAKQRADAIGCADHLKSILMAAHTWSMDNADAAPPGLAVLTNDLPSPTVLFCPANALVTPPTNWAELNWSQIDYTWMPNVDWNEPTNVACVCRIHENVGLVDGSVKLGPFRQGWPWITAGPVEALATPGETVRFAVTVTTTAAHPLAYQWRREDLHFETNAVRVTNP